MKECLQVSVQNIKENEEHNIQLFMKENIRLEGKYGMF